MKGVPEFKKTDGTTVYKEKYLSALTAAAYSGKTSCTVDREKINILSSTKLKDSWDVVVEFDYEEKVTNENAKTMA